MVTTAIDRFRAQGGEGAKLAAGLAAALQPPENIAALIASLCHDAAGRFNGEIFYLEKDRVGLFEPLAVTQDAAAPGQWSIDAFSRAIETFAPHSLGVIYADE
jgi:hypothetical protein